MRIARRGVVIAAAGAVFATAACGGGGGGSGPDARADAPGLSIDGAPDAPSDVVTVRLQPSGSGSFLAAQVVFTGPDGVPITWTDTDAAGIASAAMPGGGSITVIRNRVMDTVLGVVPGEVISISAYGSASGPHSTVTVASATPPKSYKVSGPCVRNWADSYSPSVDVIWFGCDPHPQPILVSTASTTYPYPLDGFYLVPSIDIPPGGTISAPGTYAAPTTLPVDTANLPGGVDAVTATIDRLVGVDNVFQISGPLAIVGGTATAMLGPQASTGDATYTRLRMGRGSAQEQVLGIYEPVVRTAIAVDAAASPQPWVTNVMPAPDDIGPWTGASWSVDAADTHDATLLELAQFDSGDTLVAAWRVFGPFPGAGVASVQLPQLPAPLASHWSGGSRIAVAVTIIDVPGITGYDQFRTAGVVGYPSGWHPSTVPSPGLLRTSTGRW